MAAQESPISPPSHTPLSIWILRISIACRGLGLGFSYLWHSLERESDIFGTLMFEWHLPEALAQSLEDAGMWISSVAGVMVLVVNAVGYRCLDRYRGSWWRRAERCLLAFCFVWEMALAVSTTYRGGVFFSEWCLGAHALRIAVPLALIMWNLRTHVSRSMFLLLCWATAVTFLAHGLEAIYKSPQFITMIIGAGNDWFGVDLDQSRVESLLVAIGCVDILVVILLLTTRWRCVALYMAIWGTITALGRVAGYDGSFYPETLLRMVHAGGPIFLYLEWPPRLERKRNGVVGIRMVGKFVENCGENDALQNEG